MAGRVSQLVVETINGAAANLRASQLVVEVMVGVNGHLRVSQVVVETLVGIASHARASQVVVEVLYVIPLLPAVTLPLVFPDLPGISWPVIMRPTFKSAEATSAASGRSKRVTFSTWPIWEWDISWEYLPDFQGNGLTASDFKTLAGFVLIQRGGLGTFAYRDDTFFAVANLEQMVGDGATSVFVLTYVAGLPPFSIQEPIGFLDPSEPLLVFANGVLIPQAQIVLGGSTHNQTVTLAAAPAAGVVITASFAFFFAVRFKDDTQDFEEFMGKLWTVKKLTLQSVLA